MGRIISPSGNVDAVLVKWPGSALGGGGLSVAVIRHGRPSDTDMSFVVTGSDLSLSNLTWTDSRTLEISYPRHCELLNFSNRTYPLLEPDKDPKASEIEVVLRRL